MRVWSVGAMAFALACGGTKNSARDLLPSECATHACASIDEEPTSNEFVIDLDADRAQTRFELDIFATDLGLLAGSVVLTASDPSCLASVNSPCTITLRRLRLELGSTTIATTAGDVELNDPSLSLRAPLSLVDSGSDYVVPPETDVQACAKVEGRPDSAIVPLHADSRLHVEFSRELLAFDVVFPFRFHFGDWQCQNFDATLRVTAAGRSPWTKPQP